jgi:hypothetical protein
LLRGGETVAVDFKQDYADLACVCPAWLMEPGIKWAINQMETEWATADTAVNAQAEGA